MRISNAKLKRIIPVMLMASAFSFMSPSNEAFANQRIGDDINITAEFKDTSLVDTFDALSRLSDVPIIVNGKLSDTVTMNVNGQKLSSIIDNLVRAFNLSCSEKDGMIIISDKEADSNMNTVTFKLNYLDLEEAKSDMKTFMDESKISTSTVDNTLTVTGNAIQIAKAREIIDQKDVKQDQVSLQVKFVELSKDDQKKFGTKFENTSWLKFTKVKGDAFTGYLEGTVSANGNDNTGKVIARPTVSTLNGKEATINLSDRVPILTTTTSNNNTTTTVEYQDVGVILKTTPRINKDTNEVTLNINASVSTITGRVENANVSAPQISKREVTSDIRCENGETIIIGGLLKQEDINSITNIPLLSKLPILGKLFEFRNHEKKDTELVVMLTPIIQGQEESAFEKKYMKEEKNAQNMNNDKTIDHALHTDRRGQDNRETKRI